MAQNKNYVAIHEQFGTLDINTKREKLYTAELEPLPEVYFPSKGIDKTALFTYKDKVLQRRTPRSHRKRKSILYAFL